MREFKSSQQASNSPFDLSDRGEYQFDENLCECWIKMLPDIEIKDKFDRSELIERKSDLREELVKVGLIKRDDDLFANNHISIPTCCAIDEFIIRLSRNK